MQTVYTISKEDKFLNKAGYFDNISSQIQLFDTINDANKYIDSNLPYECNITELHFILGKKHERDLLNI